MKYKLLVIAIVVVAAIKCASRESMESLARGYNALADRVALIPLQEQLDAEFSAYFAQELQNAGFDTMQTAMNIKNDLAGNNPELYVKIIQQYGSDLKAREYIDKKINDLVAYIGQN